MVTQSSVSTEKSLLIPVDPIDSGMSSEVCSDAKENKSRMKFNNNKNSKNLPPIIALGPRPDGIENSLRDSLNNSPGDLSSNDRVFQIETGGDRI